MSKVLIGMSGGVDSSAAAAILQRQGYDVIGITLKLWGGKQEDGSCCGLSAVNDARRVADMLNIPFYVLNFTEDFNKDVVDNFVNEYENGRTPNPCVECNRHIKFSKLLEKADLLDAEYIATGHYAKIEKENGRFLLKRSADEKKDQTYFLYTMTQNQLSRTLMPLYGIQKSETRKIAEEMGLIVANKPDSQEICFVSKDGHGEFIKEYTGKMPKPGNFIDKNGNILGQHKGIINYTIGQRRWLGISIGKRAFVTNIDPVNNTVTIGDDEDLLSDVLFASKLNFIPFDELNKEIKCTAKIRYAAKETPCTIIPMDKDLVKVVFDIPQRAITAGQSVVFYQNDIVLGGGIVNA